MVVWCGLTTETMLVIWMLLCSQSEFQVSTIIPSENMSDTQNCLHITVDRWYHRSMPYRSDGDTSRKGGGLDTFGA